MHFKTNPNSQLTHGGENNRLRKNWQQDLTVIKIYYSNEASACKIASLQSSNVVQGKVQIFPQYERPFTIWTRTFAMKMMI